jgi:hypothetical protein
VAESAPDTVKHPRRCDSLYLYRKQSAHPDSLKHTGACDKASTVRQKQYDRAGLKQKTLFFIHFSNSAGFLSIFGAM